MLIWLFSLLLFCIASSKLLFIFCVFLFLSFCVACQGFCFAVCVHGDSYRWKEQTRSKIGQVTFFTIFFFFPKNFSSFCWSTFLVLFLYGFDENFSFSFFVFSKKIIGYVTFQVYMQACLQLFSRHASCRGHKGLQS